jgi:ketosteroid isomerase-like protein
MLRPYTALAAIVMTACVSRTSSVRPGEVAAVGTPEEIQALVRLALTLDAAGDRKADTLYTPDALVVGNARVRLAAPRFAGISPGGGGGGGGGQVTVTAATVTLEGRFAWVLVDYRWVNQADRRAEAGRATFICEQREGKWKIVHAHSSQPLPWEP